MLANKTWRTEVSPRSPSHFLLFQQLIQQRLFEVRHSCVCVQYSPDSTKLKIEIS